MLGEGVNVGVGVSLGWDVSVGNGRKVGIGICDLSEEQLEDMRVIIISSMRTYCLVCRRTLFFINQ